MSYSEDDSDDDSRYPILLAKQRGSTVTEIGPGVVSKKGDRVTRNEAAALALVKRHTTKVPVPELYQATFFMKDGVENGVLTMEKVEGTRLDDVWDGFDDLVKAGICAEIWGIVNELRTIPKPTRYEHLYQCSADGSPSDDVLIRDDHLNPTYTYNPPSSSSSSPPTTTTRRHILDDEALRARIYERYLHFNGRLYEGSLPSMLPRSDVSVFTHGDLTPRNIMVHEGRITGVIDWEDSEWFPDYWEYANMMRPSRDSDWMRWMDRTKPIDWDISGIVKARKVLF